MQLNSILSKRTNFERNDPKKYTNFGANFINFKLAIRIPNSTIQITQIGAQKE